MDAPEKYRGRTVSVDIVEPIFWSSNGVAVEIPEHPYRLALALNLKMDTPPLVAPMRVRGVFDRCSPSSDSCYVIREGSIDRLPSSTEPAPPIDVMLANRAQWDRRRVSYEGEWLDGFETSVLDRHIWLSLMTRLPASVRSLPDLPPGEARRFRVRVEGVFLSHASAVYGHMGHYPAELFASKIELLEGAETAKP